MAIDFQHVRELFATNLQAIIASPTSTAEKNKAVDDCKLALHYAVIGAQEFANWIVDIGKQTAAAVVQEVAPVDPAAQQAQDLKNETEVQP